jgi:hypothetical protein
MNKKNKILSNQLNLKLPEMQKMPKERLYKAWKTSVKNLTYNELKELVKACDGQTPEGLQKKIYFFYDPMNLLREAMKAQEQKSHSSKKKPTTSTKKEVESNITLFFQQCKGVAEN